MNMNLLETWRRVAKIRTLFFKNIDDRFQALGLRLVM